MSNECITIPKKFVKLLEFSSICILNEATFSSRYFIASVASVKSSKPMQQWSDLEYGKQIMVCKNVHVRYHFLCTHKSYSLLLILLN